jgi:hypothetical protein
LRTREKGTGTVYKEKNRFYLKIIINGKTKTTMLRNEDGSPCTTRKEADRAADGMRKILFADTLEETAHFVQEAKRLKRQSGLLLARAWEVYLKQPDRPDSGGSTLGKYKSAFEAFLAWIGRQYPKRQLVADVDHDIAWEYMQVITQSGDSNATYNKYLQTMRLIFKHLMIPAALDANPFDGIPKKPIASTSRKEFTPEQVKAIFDGFDNGFFYETETESLAEGRKRKRRIKQIEYKPMFKDEMRVLLLLCCWTGCR